MECATNPNCDSCIECMKDAPYHFCCRDECGEHEFCRDCKTREIYSKNDETNIKIYKEYEVKKGCLKYLKA